MDRIFYKTSASDRHSKSPVYVFDTSFLPSSNDINYDELILTLMTILPSEKYTLIMFCSGLNKISWIWGVKFLKKFLIEESNLQNLDKVYTVHEGWFIKTLTGLLANYQLTRKNLTLTRKLLENFNLNNDEFKLVGSGSGGLIVNCASLFDLDQLVDIDNIKISLNVYKHDYQLDGFRSLNTAATPLAWQVPSESLKYHLYQTYNIIDTYGARVELIFQRPGNKLSSEIFVDCIKRDQIIWINDWNLYCIATSFKKIVAKLPPLLPIELITLPIKDSTLEQNFADILNHLSYDFRVVLVSIFKLLHKLVNNQHITRLTSKSLAKIFVTTLSHQSYSKANESNLIVVNSFIKKVIENFGQFGKSLTAVEMSDIFSECREENSYIDYDMTVDSDGDTDEPISEAGGDVNLSPKKVLGSNEHVLNTMTSFASISTIGSTFSKDVFLSPTKTQSPIKSSLGSPVKAAADIDASISVQYPPQRYRFNTPAHSKEVNVVSQFIQSQVSSASPKKRPVIRGVKVGELAKLYEERAQGLELLKSL
ncbi:Divergent CRAL/TRIO domain [Yamadazyma tenuis]|uniref:Rho GTPase activation protein n=1 Tax=Candida tenuis (strain ATCC 10573 / BCRC 21748 / CBS 615 / JCM 9827 / NBRC 10315 / NRRL Y-1498 / VKM Y-70) TaxID=590646 RepID=G3AXM1_CANTC|nr:Rho GTPase activation protein [Yamadazyma tenuis ATCC 10573]EGV65648.1 Rho GTPase activation protein [Yamadazyma tenuis ATCC 10573]WEJ96041.1 Divergent CRAL/TRIO domain [Yamadazyma tenuis]